MNKETAEKFAEWLAQDQPGLFVELYKRAIPSVVKGGLGDFTDILSSIGSGIGNAVSNVGTYLTSAQGMTALTSLGTAYLNTQAAKNAVSVNLQRAQAGYGPAPISTVFNPTTQQYEAVLTQPSGAVLPLNQTVRSTLTPPGVPTWVYFAAGGGLLLLLLLMRR